MRPMRSLCLALAAAGLLASAAAAAQSTMRIGLQDDPDVLDPARARTFVGRIVFASLCDKLVDISPDLKFVPQLAERSEEHTSELQSLMRSSYAVFCLKNK